MAWYEEMFKQEDPMRLTTYGESDQSRMHVDFIIEKLGIQPGARVLDLCCGQGRHLLDLMRRGYDVVGVDLSEYQLGKCREAAASQGLDPRLIRRDMREVDFDQEFDAVVNMFTSFGYLETEEEDQKVLDGIARALKPGGQFFIDTMNRDWLMREFLANRWHDNERGDIIVVSAEFDSAAGRINCTETAILSDGQRIENRHTLRIYTYRELEDKLNRAGLEICGVWGGFDGSEFTRMSRRMQVMARKQA